MPLFVAWLVVAIIAVRGANGRIGLGVTIAGFAASVAVTLFVIGRPLWRSDPDASLISARLAGGSAQRLLLARWVDRARWARYVGGTAGILFWALGTRGRGDLLVCGTLGIFLGALAAELHHVRRRPGPRTARLDMRTVATYLSRYDRDRMLATAGATAVTAIVGLTVPRTTWAPWWALGAAVVLGAAWLAQERVARRPRPATSTDITKADDLARRLAISRGLARPAIYCALAMLARAWLTMGTHWWWMSTIGLAAWIWAYILWWWNRGLGLDFLLDDEERTPLLS